jgi:hypothetical protein
MHVGRKLLSIGFGKTVEIVSANITHFPHDFGRHGVVVVFLNRLSFALFVVFRGQRGFAWLDCGCPLRPRGLSIPFSQFDSPPGVC